MLTCHNSTNEAINHSNLGNSINSGSDKLGSQGYGEMGANEGLENVQLDNVSNSVPADGHSTNIISSTSPPGSSTTVVQKKFSEVSRPLSHIVKPATLVRNGCFNPGEQSGPLSKNQHPRQPYQHQQHHQHGSHDLLPAVARRESAPLDAETRTRGKRLLNVMLGTLQAFRTATTPTAAPDLANRRSIEQKLADRLAAEKQELAIVLDQEREVKRTRILAARQAWIAQTRDRLDQDRREREERWANFLKTSYKPIYYMPAILTEPQAARIEEQREMTRLQHEQEIQNSIPTTTIGVDTNACTTSTIITTTNNTNLNAMADGSTEALPNIDKDESDTDIIMQDNQSTNTLYQLGHQLQDDHDQLEIDDDQITMSSKEGIGA